MLIPESWLRSWANPDINSQQLADVLTMAGLEVEDANPVAPAFSGVCVAKIVSTEAHPNADKLKICQVDDGSGVLQQIVCGAPNAAPGMLVPLARVGAELPGGAKIGAVKMRSVQSNGMLCSARELGLSQDHAGLLQLDDKLLPGTDLRAALDLDETIFTLKLTPNRADCLSIAGVAKELAALTEVQLHPAKYEPVAVSIEDSIPVVIKAPDLCGRFGGRVVRGVNARAQTPAWMRQRLERAGQRPISALVDISNYVMLELGRPSHVFDLAHISSGLEVRWAEPGESLELLNGQTIELEPDMGVLASGGKVQSLAGIMGGQASAVTLDTQDIFLEAAFWWPEAIMGRARRLRFGSEASHRFERGVDYASIAEHLEALTRLVVDICGGQAGPLQDQTVGVPARPKVQMRLARCNRVLGLDLSAARVADIFTRLGFEFTQEADLFSVQAPSARFDINIEEDLIEEVARVYGFEKIPDLPPVALTNICVLPEVQYGPHIMRLFMSALDYQEVINFSFVDASWERDYCANPNPIGLLNPIASHMSVMRSSLLGGLLENIRYNARRQQDRVRVFEYGRVFARDPSVADGPLQVAGIAQPNRLAAAAWGPAQPQQWGTKTRQVDFFDVKNDLEVLFGVRAAQLRFEAAEHPMLHPGRSAKILLDGQEIGCLGEVHPRWAQQLELAHAPVVFELDAQAAAARLFPQPKAISRQPLVVRDISVWLPKELPWQDLLATVWQQAQHDESLAILRDIKLFDIWLDPANSAERSLALRLWFQAKDANLDDDQIDACLRHIIGILSERHGARLRS